MCEAKESPSSLPEHYTRALAFRWSFRTLFSSLDELRAGLFQHLTKPHL